jgi:hypothetical protein
MASFFFNPVASWFETRGVAALLTMRVQDLILRACESIDFGIFDMSQIKDLEPTETPKLE